MSFDYVLDGVQANTIGELYGAMNDILRLGEGLVYHRNFPAPDYGHSTRLLLNLEAFLRIKGSKFTSFDGDEPEVFLPLALVERLERALLDLTIELGLDGAFHTPTEKKEYLAFGDAEFNATPEDHIVGLPSILLAMCLNVMCYLVEELYAY